jgi:ParB family chromosome partitioning protein
MSVKTPTKPIATATAGLQRLGKLSGLLGEIPSKPTGVPLELPLDLIDEDPDQPRTAENPGFTKESLAELAASIGPGGIKTPISVREHPTIAGRYMVNHGARRLRASRLKALATIKAFVDNDHNRTDQVIENLQRNDLTAREIANYIGRELAAGKTHREIAEAIGKSRPFVTQHAALLDLPEPIAEVFNEGRVTDVTLVNDLVRAYKADDAAVTAWLAEPNQEVTRSSVKALRAFVESDAPAEATTAPAVEAAPAAVAAPSPAPQVAAPVAKSARTPAPSPAADAAPATGGTILRKPVLTVTVAGRTGRLLPNWRPSADGRAWVCFDDDGREAEVDLDGLRVVAVKEG